MLWNYCFRNKILNKLVEILQNIEKEIFVLLLLYVELFTSNYIVPQFLYNIHICFVILFNKIEKGPVGKPFEVAVIWYNTRVEGGHSYIARFIQETNINYYKEKQKHEYENMELEEKRSINFRWIILIIAKKLCGYKQLQIIIGKVSNNRWQSQENSKRKE